MRDQIEYLNLGARLAVTREGRILPVTELYDDDGDLTDQPAEAIAFVAGRGDVWISGPVGLRTATVH